MKLFYFHDNQLFENDGVLVTSKKYVYCEANVSTSGKTGVEMEALTTVQIGLLTIYDMCKSIDKGMRITDIQLELKKGGASGEWRRTK